MKQIWLVAALAACASSSESTLPRSRITTCAQACARIQQCVARTHTPSRESREECEQSCGAMAADAQRAYAKQIGAETDCARMEPYVFLE